ncbi:hypothetical protein [Epilithonimonas hominis]|uniref:Uncharacterized protein n=1 Tax=Epilithonimonas hominis TaxID=420404 RepID=A0A1H6HSZ4_9FLAO|nr:hypothetical protein [Epilithonimonas hominis]SEH38161.1 hypothetical protein SAMN05421793_10217 [Epilithonimonas hominis]
MLNFAEKIEILKEYLSEIKDNYADSFKTDIMLYFNDFEDVNSEDFKFLSELKSKEDIYKWVDKLTSKIVMKFNEDEEQISDFIFYALNQ